MTVPAVISPRMARYAPRKKMPICMTSPHRPEASPMSASHQRRRYLTFSSVWLEPLKRFRVSSSALKLLITEKPLSRSLICAIKLSFWSLTAFSRFARAPPVTATAAMGSSPSKTSAAASSGLYQIIIIKAPAPVNM